MTEELTLVACACLAVALILFWICVNAGRQVKGRVWREKPKFNKVDIGRI